MERRMTISCSMNQKQIIVYPVIHLRHNCLFAVVNHLQDTAIFRNTRPQDGLYKTCNIGRSRLANLHESSKTERVTTVSYRDGVVNHASKFLLHNLHGKVNIQKLRNAGYLEFNV